MHAEPQQEHQWLQKLVGEWAYEVESDMGPGQSSGKLQGTERVRSLGGLWVVAEGQGEMPGGGTAHTIMTIGYDPEKKRYVGTWIGSMMPQLWLYDGFLDASGKVLTLASEGPSMAGDGTKANYRDVIEFRSDDRRVLTAHMQGDNGEWTAFMTAHYRRTK
jgi:hypothetical protein